MMLNVCFKQAFNITLLTCQPPADRKSSLIRNGDLRHGGSRISTRCHSRVFTRTRRLQLLDHLWKSRNCYFEASRFNRSLSGMARHCGVTAKAIDQVTYQTQVDELDDKIIVAQV